MMRKIENCKLTVTIIEAGSNTNKIQTWLEQQAQPYKGEKFYLLAHAEDGVIWGRLENGKLVTAPVTEFSPALSAITLLNARLFNSKREIYLWRDGEGVFKACSIADEAGDKRQYFDEEQILWGTHSQKADGFTLMSDGAQGLRHYVPISVSITGKERPLRLKVRHYLEEDDTGFVRIKLSRLVDLVTK